MSFFVYDFVAQILVAVSEIFASITSLEYAYNKAPPRMKSVVIALFLLASAFGNVSFIRWSWGAQFH